MSATIARTLGFALGFIWIVVNLLGGATARASECPTVTPSESGRYTVVISDLHFGVGKLPDGKWDPTEDFRWSNAFAGFLNRISKCGNDAVDLILAGDSLELWQPPTGKCAGAGKNTSCSPDEILDLARLVIREHKDDLAALGAFADKGSNSVRFIPGNHDAGILLDLPWQELHSALHAKSSRVSRVDSGVWVSGDGRLVVEHGHQIGHDVNRFSAWPSVLIKRRNRQYMERPWGEYFVQTLFNEQEQTYSIIDNLQPETAGVRYRMADRGFWKSVKDIARFIQFNLFETSLKQKANALGKYEDPEHPLPWDVNIGRAMGHNLFALALPADDALRAAIFDVSDDAKQLRLELDELANDSLRLSDDEVRSLCDQIAIRSDGKQKCREGDLGAGLETLLTSRRSVLEAHLNKRLKQTGLERMRLFIYAHTHSWEEGWNVNPTASNTVKVYNTGAFQRLVSEQGFLDRAKQLTLEPSVALRTLTVEQLSPCYSAVIVALGSRLPQAETIMWYMPEQGEGEFTFPKDKRCE